MTNLDEVIEVSVIPFRHNEFPRFITHAFPYYFSVFSIMAATFIFILSFLYSEMP